MEKFYEKFDSYLNGELKGEELSAFEAALQENTALQEDLKMYQKVESDLQHHFEFQEKKQQLQSTLSALNKEFFAEEETAPKVVQMKPRRPYLKWAVAAVFLILATFLIPRFLTAPNPTYANLVKMPTASFTEMGVSTDQEILATSEKAFNNKNYPQVIEILKPYVASHPKNATTGFYLALAYLETDHFNEAETLFKKLSAGDSVYATESLWYLALLELKRGNQTQFQEYLKQIPKGSAHYPDAQKLSRGN